MLLVQAACDLHKKKMGEGKSKGIYNKFIKINK